MYSKIYQKIQPKELFKKSKKVLIAVSGGVDSMNLLHFLHAFKDDLSIDIAIVHINHRQRIESDQEEAYLKSWAEEHDIPIYIKHFSGIFSENNARQFRYAFFKEIMVTYAYDTLVTAHHQDDQVETIFMRIIRGNLLRHLSSIKKVQDFGPGLLIRPFLNISKNELPNIFHFEDSSNQENDYFRNRIRNQYLPELENENPKVKESLLSLSKESQLLIKAFEHLTKDIPYQEIDCFRNQDWSVQYFLLQDYLTQFSDLTLTKAQFNHVLSLLNEKQNATFPLKNHYVLEIGQKSFRIVKIILETETQKESVLLKYDSKQEFSQYAFSYNNNEEKSEFVIPMYSREPIILRHRQEGDTIDFGKFSKKLRRLFIDEKFSHHERETAIIGVQHQKIIFLLVGNKTYLRKSPKNGIMMAKLYIEKLEDR